MIALWHDYVQNAQFLRSEQEEANMTPENQKKYDAKLKRITQSLELKEPDMIPITLSAELFPVFNQWPIIAQEEVNLSGV